MQRPAPPNPPNPPNPTWHVRRLTAADAPLAARVTRLMAQTFEEGSGRSPEQMARLLADEGFWLFAALRGGEPVGGLSAHVLPMTRADGAELFIYDLAVHPAHQRQGVGRHLVTACLRAAAGAGLLSTFVPADNDDGHALAFYRAIGGRAHGVTIFDF